MSELENNLIHLYQTFFIDHPYNETLRIPLATERLSMFQEALRTVYNTIGIDDKRIRSLLSHRRCETQYMAVSM